VAGGPSYPADSVASLAVDSDGSIYVTGQTFSPNFPTSSGAWQTNGAGGFLTKLDPNGAIVYSTFLAPQAWGLTASRVRVLNGVAYLAGSVSAAEFLGTSGALQRSVAGSADFFALAMAPDGSGPIFETAFGGSGADFLSDMALDLNGNIVMVGTSSSADFPLTSDALPYKESSQGGGVLVRIDSTGSRLISSTWLGTGQAGVVTSVADGGIVVGGNSAAPAGLPGSPAQNSITVSTNTTAAYLMKFAAGTLHPLWSSQLNGGNGFYQISADGQGNLCWPGYPLTQSGGALAYSGAGITKLSADGSLLLYASAIPGVQAGDVAAASAGGLVYVGGYTPVHLLPVTAGVVQPLPDPSQSSQNSDDGFIGVVDLTSFTTGNFFAVPGSVPASLTWRIGEPAPQPIVPVRVLVGGADAQILYAGPAPGLVAGLTQINLRIPTGAPSGLASLLVLAGDNASQPGVSLAVQ
jgi:hypothetical protein